MSDRNAIIKELLKELQMKMKAMMVKGLGDEPVAEVDPLNPKQMSDGDIALDPEAAEAEGMDQLPESLASTDQPEDMEEASEKPEDDNAMEEVKEQMGDGEKDELKAGLHDFLQGKKKPQPKSDSVTVSLMGMKGGEKSPNPGAKKKGGYQFKKKK